MDNLRSNHKNQLWSAVLPPGAGHQDRLAVVPGVNDHVGLGGAVLQVHVVVVVVGVTVGLGTPVCLSLIR